MEVITSIVSNNAIEKLKEVQMQLEIMRNCELELNRLGMEIEIKEVKLRDDFFERG